VITEPKKIKMLGFLDQFSIYRKFKNSYLGTLRPKSGIVGQAR